MQVASAVADCVSMPQRPIWPPAAAQASAEAIGVSFYQNIGVCRVACGMNECLAFALPFRPWSRPASTFMVTGQSVATD